MKKKIDNRIRTLIENGVALNQRTLFFVVGNQGRNQVVILHHMLSKTVVKARPSVLWCYKKELGFSSHRRKRMKKLQKKAQHGNLNVDEDDPFELFVAATNIRYCFYKETHKILGSTYGFCVLQDFEAITPNLLARTIETVEGGGIIVVLLKSVESLKQLYTMSMDVHDRFRTESHQDVVCRFNERLILSLASCSQAIVVDDELNVLPLSSKVLNISPVPPRSKEDPLPPNMTELKELKESLADTQPVSCLLNCCRTLDQAKALLKFVEAISEKSLRSTVALTAARGRGKSAALGLAVASAVAFGYSNIFVTSPSPENLKTLFEFIFKGFDALEFVEHVDYDLVQSTNPEFNKAIVRVNIFKDHRQTIQYIHPKDSAKLGQAELVVIDEAAAIPLPLVKSLLGPYLVFMSSTVNGYEGTGRSLSLKLIQQLRNQNKVTDGDPKPASSTALGRTLAELSLDESIRYAPGDQMEKWLNDLLCLDVTSGVAPLASGCPPPVQCDLYYVNRDTLFSYHRASEAFLQRLMSIYVAAHYRNTPNDLQMISDAPAHHLFCLLGPVDPQQNSLPEILCVIQVCLEGEISKNSVMSSLSRGKRADGDMIPWTVSQQFQDPDFAGLSGARVVRIATHPDYQGMGYGAKAMQLLQHYYEGKFPSLKEDSLPVPVGAKEDSATPDGENLRSEKIAPRKKLPPLLLNLNERPPEHLDYLGVAYGLTEGLLKFWKKSGFSPVYLRQTSNQLTGEHTCIMLKVLEGCHDGSWLHNFFADFSKRFLSLLSYQFRSFSPKLSLMILQQKLKERPPAPEMTRQELQRDFSSYDIKRLDLYAQNMADYHLVTDLMPAIARRFFMKQLGIDQVSAVQSALLLGVGLQHKTIDDLEKEIEIPASQLLGLFNRLIRKVVSKMNQVVETAVAKDIGFLAEETGLIRDEEPSSITQTLENELTEGGKEETEKVTAKLNALKGVNLKQFEIRGSESQWTAAMKAGSKMKGIVSVAGGKKEAKKRKTEEAEGEADGKKKPKQLLKTNKKKRKIIEK